MKKLKKKVEFIFLDWEGECQKHPNSKFLGVEDDGVLTTWCMECVYRILKDSKGWWDVEHKEES